MGSAVPPRPLHHGRPSLPKAAHVLLVSSPLSLQRMATWVETNTDERVAARRTRRRRTPHECWGRVAKTMTEMAGCPPVQTTDAPDFPPRGRRSVSLGRPAAPSCPLSCPPFPMPLLRRGPLGRFVSGETLSKGDFSARGRVCFPSTLPPWASLRRRDWLWRVGVARTELLWKDHDFRKGRGCLSSVWDYSSSGAT